MIPTKETTVQQYATVRDTYDGIRTLERRDKRLHRDGLRTMSTLVERDKLMITGQGSLGLAVTSCSKRRNVDRRMPVGIHRYNGHGRHPNERIGYGKTRWLIQVYHAVEGPR
jgi:hypothetical protein